MLDFELRWGKYTVNLEDFRVPESKENKRQKEHVKPKTKQWQPV